MAEAEEQESLTPPAPFRVAFNTPIDALQTPMKPSENFQRIYGGLLNISATALDVSLLFGHPITEDRQNIYIEKRVSLTMSWQAAKLLANTLLGAVQNYERQYGEVRSAPLPPQSVRPGASNP